MKNIIYIYILLSFLYPGTLFFSKTLDSVETNTDTYIIDYQIKNTYSFGYEHAIWQKRKIKYDVFAGGELLTNSDVKFLNVYVLARYKINKLISIWSTIGLGFYDPKKVSDDNGDSNFEEEFLPNSKGGYTYGLGFTYYLNKGWPLSIHHKVYNASEVHSNEWMDITFSRSSFQIGYEF